jgi:hypothetical protein
MMDVQFCIMPDDIPTYLLLAKSALCLLCNPPTAAGKRCLANSEQHMYLDHEAGFVRGTLGYKHQRQDP